MPRKPPKSLIRKLKSIKKAVKKSSSTKPFSEPFSEIDPFLSSHVKPLSLKQIVKKLSPAKPFSKPFLAPLPSQIATKIRSPLSKPTTPLTPVTWAPTSTMLPTRKENMLPTRKEKPTPPPKPITRPTQKRPTQKLSWTMEWKLAKDYFQGNPTARKFDKNENPLRTHYFIKAEDGKIYAINPGNALGAGAVGKTKLAYDQERNEFAIKARGIKAQSNDDKEFEALRKMGLVLGKMRIDYQEAQRFDPQIRKKDRSSEPIKEGEKVIEAKEWLIIPFYSGGSLANKIQEIMKKAQSKEKTLQEILPFLKEAAIAVQEAHAKGVIHSDIKLDNFMLDNEDHVHLIDFGESHVLKQGTSTYITTGQSPGTKGFCAPEVSDNEKEQHFSAQSDIYSLGHMFEKIFSPLTKDEIYESIGKLALEEGKDLIHQKNIQLMKNDGGLRKDMSTLLHYAYQKNHLSYGDFATILKEFTIQIQSHPASTSNDLLSYLKDCIQAVTRKNKVFDLSNNKDRIKLATMAEKAYRQRIEANKKTVLGKFAQAMKQDAPQNRPSMKVIIESLQIMQDGKKNKLTDTRRDNKLAPHHKKNRVADTLESKIAKANSLNELMSIITNYDNKVLRISPTEKNLILEQLNNINKNKLVNLSNIPSQYGIQDKVKQLCNYQEKGHKPSLK